jgi:hypothetical protein
LCYDLALARAAEVMTEEPKSFTVKDRRHFTPDGRTREPEEDEAPSPPPREPSPPAPDEEASPFRASHADEPERAPGGEAAPEGGAPVDFAQFLLSLGAQASLLLSGQIEGESPAQALAGARSMIGILEMLKDKTEGRRSAREEQVLDGLLYELRMAYVARARETGA